MIAFRKVHTGGVLSGSPSLYMQPDKTLRRRVRFLSLRSHSVPVRTLLARYSMAMALQPAQMHASSGILSELLSLRSAVTTRTMGDSGRKMSLFSFWHFGHPLFDGPWLRQNQLQKAADVEPCNGRRVNDFKSKFEDCQSCDDADGLNDLVDPTRPHGCRSRYEIHITAAP